MTKGRLWLRTAITEKLELPEPGGSARFDVPLERHFTHGTLAHGYESNMNVRLEGVQKAPLRILDVQLQPSPPLRADVYLERRTKEAYQQYLQITHHSKQTYHTPA